MSTTLFVRATVVIVAVVAGCRWLEDDQTEAAIEQDCRLRCRYERYQAAGYDADGKSVADGHLIPEARANAIATACRDSCAL